MVSRRSSIKEINVANLKMKKQLSNVKIFDGLEQMCKEHLPSVVHYLAKLRESCFPASEADFPENTTYKEWEQFDENWYQGEVDNENQFHGQGIVILP